MINQLHGKNIIVEGCERAECCPHGGWELEQGNKSRARGQEPDGIPV